ncbi:DMT family transporter [Bacillus ginsengihumi]|uniref:DMT family transporter n=2 Tax=Heyndrickxia ginsengihumi TaxID=363870 RepID=A0A6M0PAH5_9BACI|nr:DMT family transporter [Heyndrickxia ginsengihumi]MBE6184246.1 DMT family transporter [Bacillus sp. (in: firmicutes)]NEY21511.1 DMT family transporter [Heyndrickxia ginsengihumi]
MLQISTETEVAMFKKKKPIAMFKMIISMIIFGSIGFLSEHTNLPSLELVFVRCFCATVCLSIFWILSGQFKREKWYGREVVHTLVCGFFLVCNWLFLFKAFGETSVTIAISVYHLAPVLVLLFGSILYKEKLTFISIISMIICFAGTILISNTSLYSFNQFLSSGMIWALLAALFYCFTTLTGKGIHHLSPLATTILQTLLGVMMLCPFVHFHLFTNLTHLNWIAVLTTGIIHTGIVYLLFFDSLRVLPTTLISILVFLDPCVAILLDILFTGFHPNLLQTLGIIFIFSGMAFTLIKKDKSVRKNQTVLD